MYQLWAWVLSEKPWIVPIPGMDKIEYMEWFSEIESERMKYYSCQEVKTTVSIDGDKATFVSRNLLDARIWGSRNHWRLQQVMQLEKRNGKWIILKSVASTF